MLETVSKTKNPLLRLIEFGQSPWLDFINRTHTEDGSLKKLVDEDGLRGMTSNPSIFEKTMGYGTAYDAEIRQIVKAEPSITVGRLYEKLAVSDIRAATALLRGVFDEAKGGDGTVSMEVSPQIAHHTQETIEEGRRLWDAVGVPNLMIKIPGTEKGAPAIRQLTSEGISVNVTLLFSQEAYRSVLEAYIAGLEARHARGEDLSRVSSVASFYIGRVDVMVDGVIDDRVASGDAKAEVLKSLRGRVAIANAKLAYKHWKAVMASARWQALAKAGANPQRLLWASTSTKDEQYSDVLYVDELIGPETVNTMPLPTFDAFRDHGTVADTLGTGEAEAEKTIKTARASGIDLDRITSELLRDGLASFIEAFDQLMGVLEKKKAQFSA